MTLSAACPKIVDEIVRDHRCLPAVNIFIFAITKALIKSPIQNAIIEPITILHVVPNTVISAGCNTSLKGSSEYGGREIMICAILVAKIIAAKPTQITFLVLA